MMSSSFYKHFIDSSSNVTVQTSCIRRQTAGDSQYLLTAIRSSRPCLVRLRLCYSVASVCLSSVTVCIVA